LKERGIKIVRDLVKVEDGGVQHKKYDGHYSKQKNWNSKSYMNITHFKEKVHMLSVF
jgi:hypothetical protein